MGFFTLVPALPAVLALDSLEKDPSLAGIYNCGYGKGHSVLEVIKTLNSLTTKDIKVKHTARRPGDAASIVASSQKLQEKLGWTPRFNNLREIVNSALLWEKKLVSKTLTPPKNKLESLKL